MSKNIQIAKLIFHSGLSTMKQILDLAEYKMKKDSDEFKYFRKQVMDYTYRNLKKLFKVLLDAKLLKRCPKHCSLRKGYSDCECGGSGFVNNE